MGSPGTIPPGSGAPGEQQDKISVEDQDGELSSFMSLFDSPDESVCEFRDVTLVAQDGFHPRMKIEVSSCILASSSRVFKLSLIHI